MVLQRQAKTPIWGWADPGETVTVKTGSITGNATADARGKWLVNLDGLKTSSTPIEITVSGKSKTITLSDVLVGDVWYCSGQSNMEIPLSYVSNAAAEISQANRPTIRLFIVFHRPAIDPQEDCRGEWKVCTPDSAKGFSAIGYLFGKEINDAEHVPVGLIGAYSGGSLVSAWTSLGSLEANPDSKKQLGDLFVGAKALVPKTGRTEGSLSPEQIKINSWADLITGQFVHDDWYDNQGGKPYAEAMQKWHADADPLYAQWKMDRDNAVAQGQPTPHRPTLSPTPTPPAVKEPRAMDGRQIPTMLYNGMLAPVLPYAIKGVIWYQGESDRNIGIFYRKLFPRMIADWRQQWGEGDFPFIFVQLAGFTSTDDLTNNNWSLIQEAQLMTLDASPNTAMAVADDIGDLKNIHPHDKIDIAHRVALAAEHLAYNEKVPYSGPIYDSFKVEGDKIKVTFKNGGSGLKIGLPPAAHLALFPEELSTDMKGFQISGSDMNFVPATAVIDGPASVTVSSDQVKTPVAVRYSWENIHGNLYNQDDLPASPFRTDTSTPALSIKPPPTPTPSPSPVNAGASPSPGR